MKNPTPANLTPNEIAVLTSLAAGSTVADIASEWAVSDTIIYRNIDRARRKLGAHTTAHAVALWVAMQLEHKPSENGHRNKVREGVSA